MRAANTHGFTLLEVLLSLVILSIALLGLLELQTDAIRYSYSALLRAQGEIQLVNLVQQTLLTEQPDIPAWEESNQLYLPNSSYQINQHELNLNWLAYQQADNLLLKI